MSTPEYWQTWSGPTGSAGPIKFLGVTGAVTGPAFFGVTGATGPTGLQRQPKHMQYLYDRARIQLVGASDAMIRSVMFEVFHEFFNDSSIWTETIPGLLQPSVIFYYLQPGNVQSPLDPEPEGHIIGFYGLVDYNHFPYGADMPEPPVMRLQFPQNNTLSVFATVIKNVTVPHDNDLPHIPHWVVSTFETHLLAGVIGKMQLQANRPYSDPKLGMMNYAMFRQGVNMARVRAMRRNTEGTNAWAYPQQYRMRTQRGGVTVGNERMF